MAARPTFRQADLVRAIRASRKGGLEIARTEIDPDGRIILFHAAAAEAAPASPFDAWKAGRDAR